MELNYVTIAATGLALGLAFLYFTKRRPSSSSSSSSASSSSSSSSFQRGDSIVDLCGVDDLRNGEMREMEVGPKQKVLLVKTSKGKFYATGTKCTHYGAPLIKGVLKDDRVTCPWHGACFNVTSGDIEDAPAIDNIPKFEVKVVGNRVQLKKPEEFPGMRCRPSLCGSSSVDRRTFAIVGGGAAGLLAAQTLRTEGFQGKVVILSEEPHFPYDRVKLSKSFGVSVSSIELRGEEFFKEAQIQFMSNTKVTKVDVDLKTISYKTKSAAAPSSLTYDKVLLATGGFARRIRCEGHDLKNIHVLREPEDAKAINDCCKNGAQNVVIIGSSFIGMEAAASLKSAKKIPNVTVVGMEKVPFERVLGVEVGTAMQKLHLSKGIQFRMESMLKRYVGENGAVTGVELESGEVIPADFVVVGAGIIPSTDYLKDSSVELQRDGSIIVNSKLQYSEDVYVAGDIARFPYWRSGETIRIEHWDVAQQHGRVAARNMMGKEEEYKSVPFFWTAQYGASLRYAGNAMKFDEVIIRGDTEKKKFVAYYVNDGRVDACATLGADPVAVAAAELFRLGQMPSPDKLRAEGMLYLASLL